MAVTDNGWPVVSRHKASFTAPNRQTPDVASADLAVLFAYVVMRWHTEIEPVTACYGGRTRAENAAVNGAPNSNHCSDTAIDVNGALHPYELRGGPWTSGFTAAGLRRLRAILADCEVLQWGGDFDSPYRDGMHVQVRQAFTGYRSNGPRPRVVSKRDVRKAARKVGGWVKRVQATVGATEDGLAGPGYIRAVRHWQAQQGLTVDGVFGPASQAAAGWDTDKPAVKPKPQSKPPTTRRVEMHGLDVSSHQSVADWRNRHPEVLIAKSTEGLSWQDPRYPEHKAAAIADDVFRAAYLYVWPEYDPVACCTNFLKISGLRPGRDVGVVDFEPYHSKVPESHWPAWVVAFILEYRRRMGHSPVIYLNDDMATRLLRAANAAQRQVIRSCPLWKARYADDIGSLHGWPEDRVFGWQYDATDIDKNRFYTTVTDVATGGSDMPDRSKADSWHKDAETRKLHQGWNLLRIGTTGDGRPRFSVAHGGLGVASISLALRGLPAGQEVRLRARSYKRGDDGQWHPVNSYGAREFVTLAGDTLAGLTQTFDLAHDRRLRWEIHVPADCEQIRANVNTLTWK